MLYYQLIKSPKGVGGGGSSEPLGHVVDRLNAKIKVLEARVKELESNHPV